MKRVTKKNVVDVVELAEVLVGRQDAALEAIGGWDDADDDLDFFWDEVDVQYPILGWGSNRVAIAAPGGKLVIKLPRTHYGLNDNESEGQRWLESSHRLRRHLAPVYAWTESFVVMRRCEQVSAGRLELLGWHRALWTIETSETFSDVYDTCSLANWGVLGRRPVLLDYGFTP